MTAFHLKDPSISAHMLNALGYDVVVSSFEFVEANYSKRQRFMDDIARWRAAGNPATPVPIRPTVALATEFWEMGGIPIKRCYVDEAQMVNKRAGKRHIALKSLPVVAWVLMSGTLAHNRWHDISGYIDFLRGHVYKTEDAFNRQFSRPGHGTGHARQIEGPQMALLQRFLQVFLIMRPKEVLKLPPCNRLALPVELDPSHEYEVFVKTEKYKRLCRMGSDFALGAAIRAQLYALHPRLLVESEGKDFEPDDEDIANTTADQRGNEHASEDPSEAAKRGEWLEELQDWTDDMIYESPQVTRMVELVDVLVTHHPEEKIVLVSQYLKYLDILNLALKRRGVECLRFDGTQSHAKRKGTMKVFEEAGVGKPLLITVGAGSVGLNLQSGRVVIIAEEWWNDNVVKQVISRCWRQGASGIVKVIKFHVANSAIDAEISRVRSLKVATNDALMGPLYHKHDEIPKVVDLLY